MLNYAKLSSGWLRLYISRSHEWYLSSRLTRAKKTQMQISQKSQTIPINRVMNAQIVLRKQSLVIQILQ